jgi:hypothetical protein
VIQKLVLVTRIVANALPVLGMIALVPLVEDDYVLSAIYVFIIIVALWVHHDKKDVIAVIFGFVMLFIAEYLFISTGVETFSRTSLFGIMPLWLPLLWAYAFYAIRRVLAAVDRYAA